MIGRIMIYLAALVFRGRWYLALANVLLLCLPTPAVAADALPLLNAQRAYFHLYELQPDARLQAEAQRRADELASVRPKPLRHLRGRRAGRYEGIGVKSGSDLIGKRFFSCGQNTRRYKRAGAATAVGGGRTWYALEMQ